MTAMCPDCGRPHASPDCAVCAPGADQAYERLREELMRVGLMAVSERQDGCINKTTALRIREIAYRACWPDDSGAVS